MRPTDNGDRDLLTAELRHLKLRVRGDLAYRLDENNDPPCYLVEDRIRSRYYRVGLPEHDFIVLLDGSRTVAEALTACAHRSGADAIDEHDAVAIVDWLIETQLAEPASGYQADTLSDTWRKGRRAKRMRFLNPLFIKIPLCNPDRFLEGLLPWCRWLLGPGFFIVWCAMLASGIYQVASNWDRFTSAASGFFALDNWLWLLLTWLVLKCIHELFHGLMCKKYGGDLYEAGAILVLFAPIGYVDATSSWRFPSRWQRVFTATAGMYIELFIAAAAAWVWAGTDTGHLNFMAFNVVILASINALLFNANPLMKFDGYYVLTDLVKIPNLYARGQGFLKAVGKRWFLGMHHPLPDRPAGERLFVAVYGILAFLWRILVIATLLIIASTMGHGAGIIAAALAAGVLFGPMLMRLLRFLGGDGHERPSLVHLTCATAITAAVLTLGLRYLTLSPTLTAPAYADFRDTETLHAGSSGFVEAIHTREGQPVNAGDVLLELRNPELETTVRDLQLELEAMRLNQRAYTYERDVPRSQALAEQIAASELRLADLEERLAELTITAPADGMVLTHGLDRMQDRFVRQGERLLELAIGTETELAILVSQKSSGAFRERVGRDVTFHIDGRQSVLSRGMLESLEPRASDTVRFPALTAIGGGPLAVVEVAASGERARNALLEPSFEGRVLPGPGQPLQPGETGVVMLRADSRPIAVLWADLVRDWVRNLTSPPRDARA